jgi:secreted PhoX family phosphatase
MNEIDRQQRQAMVKYSRMLQKGQISRREFLKLSAMAGFGITSAYFLGGCAPQAAATPTAAQIQATEGPTSASVAGTPQHGS